MQSDPPQRDIDPFNGVVCLARGPFNPGLATGSCVSSTKSILWQWRQEYRINIQVLLDDGNRIIIPQGNFKLNFAYTE